jgi:ribonuclease BN (tRNA processing enzyme)
VKLTVIGCSPAWPNPGGAQSGYLVESNGTRVLLDCGPGVLGRMRGSEPWPTLDAIVISQFHLDHWVDLVPLVWGTMFRAQEHRGPELALPPGGSATLVDHGSRLGFPNMFGRVFAEREFEPREPFAVNGIRITTVPMLHYRMPAFGMRVEADGVTLAYSADTGPTEALDELAHDADLFVCEATLRDGAADGIPRGHLSAQEAIAAFERAGARRLLLTHRPLELDLPGGVEQAYDGLELELELDSERVR